MIGTRNESTVTYMTNYMDEERYRHYESLGFTREQIDSDLAKSERQEAMDILPECEICGAVDVILFWSQDNTDRQICSECLYR